MELTESKTISKYMTGNLNSSIATTQMVPSTIVRLIKQEDEHIYEGQINKDQQRHGFGRLILSNGDCHIGLWHNDQQHGFGRFSDGEAILKGELGIPSEGIWKNGEFASKKRVFYDF
jgi:hypothetical protein